MNVALANKANASDLKALTDAVKDKVDVDTLKKNSQKHWIKKLMKLKD